MRPYEHPEARERRLREEEEARKRATQRRTLTLPEAVQRLQGTQKELAKTQRRLEEERDSLVTANRSIRTLHQVQEEIINELRAKMVKAENPSAVKALTEEREALTKTRESLTKAREALTEECDQLRAQLAQARKELKRAREQREEARGQAADTEAGLVATITDDGVTMHGHLAEGSTYEQRAAVLNRAVNLLVFTPTPK